METNFSKIRILYFIIIFLSLTFINCQKTIQNNTKNNKQEVKRRNLERIKKRKDYISKRKLDDNSVESFPYHIYLDLFNFNQTIPNSLKDYKNTIILAMKKAKETIESLIEILDFGGLGGDEIRKDYFVLEISHYNETLLPPKPLTLDDNTPKLKVMIHEEKINMIIFFKFSNSILEEDNIASAKIFHNPAYPEIGIITLSDNIPPSKLTTSYLEPLMLHLFTHLLGFHISEIHDILFVYEDDDDASKCFIENINDEPLNVIKYARKYFDDESINQIELQKDEQGNLHWPSRFFLGEYMTQFNYPEELAISRFTLAFLEDLEYYKINYFTGGLMRFGKHKGQNFLSQKCENNVEKFKNEFYYPSEISLSITEPSCTSGRQSKAVYKLFSYEDESGLSTIPEEYIYFEEYNTIGGFDSAEYCPVSQSISLNKNTDRCSENNVPNSIIGESFSSVSFCALSSLIKKSSNSEEVFRAGCFEMYCSEKSLTIKVGQEYFVCPREGGKITEETNYKGYLLCPDFNLICTANVTCNNMFDCVQKKSEEYEIEYDYDIETTQISSEYDNNENVKIAWELADNGKSKCPQYCSYCNINGHCLKCGTNYKVSDNKCVEKVPNCKTYDSDGNCDECKTDYTFVDGNKTICLKISELGNQYFQDSSDPKNYIKCSTAIPNCDRCTNANACTKCISNYAIIDESNPTECVDISANEYYLDENQKYKKCSTVSSLGNCKKCLKNNDILNCIECEEDNSLVHKDTDTCVLKSVIENENHDDLFTDDNGLNYYLCSNSLYHSVEHCLKCNTKELCNSCQKDYEITNSNTLCMLKSDTLSQRYYKDPNDNNYYLCSDKIKGCDKCTDGNTCISCKEDFDLNENNKCVHISILMLKYYYDQDIGKYVSCSKIENCEECTSKTECTKCQNGYQMKEGDNTCEKSNDSKLMALASAAVALSTIAVALSIAILIIILYNKFFAKSRPVEIETIPGNEDNENGVVIQTTKRSIKNN